MTHGYRKFAMSHAEQGGMKSINVKVLMGHSIGVEDSYYMPQEKDISEDYKNAIPSLTISSNKSRQTEVAEAKEIQALKEKIAKMEESQMKMEESQMKFTELLEVMKIAKSSDGKLGKDSTMLDEKRRVTIGYVDDNNRSVETKVPLDGFEIDEAGADMATSHLPKRRVQN